MTQFKLPESNKLTGEEAAWLAGIIDCDGSITYKKRPNNQYHLKVTNTNKDLIDKVVAITGVNHVQETPAEYFVQCGRPKCNAIYNWVVSRATDVIKLLKEIEPHLVVKKNQCREAIRHSEKRLRTSKSSLSTPSANPTSDANHPKQTSV